MVTVVRDILEERSLSVGDMRLQAFVGGSGQPLLVLHRDLGNPGSSAFSDALAASFTVTQPSHPGFDGSDRPDWLRSVRDTAVVYLGALREWEFERPMVVGLGIGGWIAAHMATMAPRGLGRMVLISPAGVKPAEGEIFDQVLVTHDTYVPRMFDDKARCEQLFGAQFDEETVLGWMANQEMLARIAWAPWLYDLYLPQLLRFADVETLVLFSEDDRIVPSACGSTYAECMPRATHELLPGGSHVPEMERPEKIAQRVVEFLIGGSGG
jgi:pimeloyl-ACP methyl ester carboxylesterase